MNHFIGQADENNYLNNYADGFVGSRIDVVLESDVFAEINYIPFHEAEGYGFFKHMDDLNETPGSRDIVLYDALPNSLPRVGGIMTSVIQTPLSHVNLRAIQDNVPNAYISDPLSIDSIANLLGSYIYFKVENETFQIREATLDEVNAWSLGCGKGPATWFVRERRCLVAVCLFNAVEGWIGVARTPFHLVSFSSGQTRRKNLDLKF